MTSHAEKAKELFENGYNCAQSVFATYAPEFGIDFNTALKLSSSFGGGMGRLREVCGAVSGIFMVLGLSKGYISPIDIDAKAEHYERVQHLAKEFEKVHGSIICRELLGLDCKSDSYVPSERTETYYQTRPCGQFIYDACEILDKYLQEINVEQVDLR